MQLNNPGAHFRAKTKKDGCNGGGKVLDLSVRHCSAVAVLSARIHNTRVVSSISPCVTIKTPLVGKAMGNHLRKSTSLQ